MEIPQAMTSDQIELWVQWFVHAANIAALAGFNIVELHAAHGYGLNQWLSPVTNQREDEFGGDITNRAKLLFRIVTKIKTQFPELLLAVRLPAQDHYTGGLSASEMIWVVNQLEILGVDFAAVGRAILKKPADWGSMNLYVKKSIGRIVGVRKYKCTVNENDYCQRAK